MLGDVFPTEVTPRSSFTCFPILLLVCRQAPVQWWTKRPRLLRNWRNRPRCKRTTLLIYALVDRAHHRRCDDLKTELASALNSVHFTQTQFYSLTRCILAEFEEEEVKVLTRLKETVDKQRDELRAMKRELQQKTVDCEAVSTKGKGITGSSEYQGERYHRKGWRIGFVRLGEVEAVTRVLWGREWWRNTVRVVEWRREKVTGLILWIYQRWRWQKFMASRECSLSVVLFPLLDFLLTGFMVVNNWNNNNFNC